MGGQRSQLEKTAAIVGKDLLDRVTGQKRSRNNLVATVPEDLPENSLAPPVQKRPRNNKAVIIILLITMNTTLTIFTIR